MAVKFYPLLPLNLFHTLPDEPALFQIILFFSSVSLGAEPPILLVVGIQSKIFWNRNLTRFRMLRLSNHGNWNSV